MEVPRVLALAQGLHERNPASHLVWWVAGAALALVAVIVLVELVDWLKHRTRRPSTGAPPSEPWRLKEPQSTLRRRFLRRLAPRRRLWPWGDRQRDD